MLQCYHCHCEVETDAVRRRVVNTGRSLGGNKGFANYYRKVVLCPRCASLHDYWQRFRSRLWLVIAGLVAVGAAWFLVRRAFY